MIGAEGPHFDRQRGRPRQFRSPRERRVEIGGLDDGEAADVSLRLLRVDGRADAVGLDRLELDAVYFEANDEAVIAVHKHREQRKLNESLRRRAKKARARGKAQSQKRRIDIVKPADPNLELQRAA